MSQLRTFNRHEIGGDALENKAGSVLQQRPQEAVRRVEDGLRSGLSSSSSGTLDIKLKGCNSSHHCLDDDTQLTKGGGDELVGHYLGEDTETSDNYIFSDDKRVTRGNTVIAKLRDQRAASGDERSSVGRDNLVPDGL
jgi:hypothetical protein